MPSPRTDDALAGPGIPGHGDGLICVMTICPSTSQNEASPWNTVDRQKYRHIVANIDNVEGVTYDV